MPRSSLPRCMAAGRIAALTVAVGARVDGAPCFARLDALLPTQTVRSEEQIEFQQFATPPRLAWLAARACASRPSELVLEPSAGTGMLAVWAAKARRAARAQRNLAAPPRMP